MSKTLFFGAAALGGMAFFTMISRYGLFPARQEPTRRAEVVAKTRAGLGRARSSRAKMN